MDGLKGEVDSAIRGYVASAVAAVVVTSNAASTTQSGHFGRGNEKKIGNGGIWALGAI